MDETSDKYNIPFLLKVSPDTDEERLAAAIRAAVEAHPAMKCSIDPDKEFVAVMTAHPDLEWELPVERSDLDDKELEEQLSGERIVFNLRRAPLFRFRIIRGRKSVYPGAGRLSADHVPRTGGVPESAGLAGVLRL